MTDPSISMQVAYNYRAPDGALFFGNLYNDDGVTTKHNSLFTGNSIGYNVLDRYLHSNSLYYLFPSVWHIRATSGWYNVGAYNGANGTVRSEMLHTYTNYAISVSPSISAPPAPVSFSFTGETVDKVDKAWVYAVVSPN